MEAIEFVENDERRFRTQIPLALEIRCHLCGDNLLISRNGELVTALPCLQCCTLSDKTKKAFEKAISVSKKNLEADERRKDAEMIGKLQKAEFKAKFAQHLRAAVEQAVEEIGENIAKLED